MCGSGHTVLHCPLFPDNVIVNEMNSIVVDEKNPR